MYKNGLVSIIMPSYNCGEFVKSTVESVIDQTYKDWELIIVDDCSSDNTLEILASYDDARVIVISSLVNVGAGGARNIGLDKAQGQFIAFLDADDLWDSSKLYTQLKHMKKNGYPISHTSYDFVTEEGASCEGGVSASQYVDLYKYMCTTEIGMSTSLIDRGVIGDFNLDLVRTRQDTKLWLDLLGKGFISSGCPEVLASYRVRQGQISGNKFKMLSRTFSVFWAVKQYSPNKRIMLYLKYVINAINKRF